MVIPLSNVKHLMLRADVVATCREGNFRIYAAQNVDEVIELLTGVAAETINARVAAQLAELSAARQSFAAEHHHDDDAHAGPDTGKEASGSAP